MSYRTLLFDFDHTLFDTDAAERHAYITSMTAAGVDDSMQFFDRYHRINQALWRSVERGEISPADVRRTRFDQLAGELDLDVDVERLSADFLAAMAEGGGWYPGAEALLDRLAGAGFRLALITNAISQVQRRRLERLGGEEYFDPIVISTEIGHAKPSAAFFDVVFDELGARNRRTALVIGDSLTSDIAGGVAAGVDTCWFNPSGRTNDARHTPTFEVASFDDLSALLAGDR